MGYLLDVRPAWISILEKRERDKLVTITIEGKGSSCEFRLPYERGIHVYWSRLCVPCGRLWKYNSLLPYILYSQVAAPVREEIRARALAQERRV